MAKATTVWGIDIGQVALKALKVCNQAGELQVEAFEVIEHAKILSQPDANRTQLIQESLEQFLSRHDMSGASLAVSVPGQTGFMRFVKLPPVDAKKIPDIVRYEAEQQIPFPIAEVNWQWQRFQDTNSPDVEVGIFAMKRTDVSEALEQLLTAGLKADLVQMAPLALCNFMDYDGQLAEDGATLLADVGADKTDLVVCDGPRIWTRTVQIGGNNFTEALVRAFKLSFSKAEKLKRTAATSKYARQIFQAMRPVFADLVQEIQRSIGHYSSLHREARFRRLIGLGNGFRLPGLQKYLEQNLNVPVMRIDSYNNLTTGPSVTAPTFNEHVLSLAVSYGLAVQALTDSPRVHINLLPEDILRQRMWGRKRLWFTAAAAMLVGTFAMQAFRAFADRSVLASPDNLAKYNQGTLIVRGLNDLKREYQKLSTQGDDEKRQIGEWIDLLGYRDYWPSVEAMVSEAIRAVSGEEMAQMARYVRASNEADRQKVLKEITGKERRARKLITMLSLTAEYIPDLSKEVIAAGAPRGGLGTAQPQKPVAGAESGTAERGFRVKLLAVTPYGKEGVNSEVLRLLQNKSAEYLAAHCPSVGFVKFAVLSEPKELKAAQNLGVPLGVRKESSSGDGGATVAYPDPLTGEEMGKDTLFEVQWTLSIQGTGIPPLEPPSQAPTR